MFNPGKNIARNEGGSPGAAGVRPAEDEQNRAVPAAHSGPRRGPPCHCCAHGSCPCRLHCEQPRRGCSSPPRRAGPARSLHFANPADRMRVSGRCHPCGVGRPGRARVGSVPRDGGGRTARLRPFLVTQGGPVCEVRFVSGMSSFPRDVGDKEEQVPGRAVVPRGPCAFLQGPVCSRGAHTCAWSWVAVCVSPLCASVSS